MNGRIKQDKVVVVAYKTARRTNWQCICHIIQTLQEHTDENHSIA